MTTEKDSFELRAETNGVRFFEILAQEWSSKPEDRIKTQRRREIIARYEEINALDANDIIAGWKKEQSRLETDIRETELGIYTILTNERLAGNPRNERKAILEKEGKLHEKKIELEKVQRLLRTAPVEGDSEDVKEAKEKNIKIYRANQILNAPRKSNQEHLQNKINDRKALYKKWGGIAFRIGAIGGAVIGAAIGTALMPGAGTMVGAAVGASIGGLVGAVVGGPAINALINEVIIPLNRTRKQWSKVKKYGRNPSLATNEIATGQDRDLQQFRNNFNRRQRRVNGTNVVQEEVNGTVVGRERTPETVNENLENTREVTTKGLKKEQPIHLVELGVVNSPKKKSEVKKSRTSGWTFGRKKGTSRKKGANIPG